jgi:hypothetical protein
MPLQRNPNFADADKVYTAIMEAHRGLTEAESAALNARLVLLLVNHIGDEDVVREALDIARAAATSGQG